MNGPDISKTLHTPDAEALHTVPGHLGPTADRYQSALQRYVEAVAVSEPPPSGEETARRLTFPPLTVSDVMTPAVVTAYRGAPFKEIANALDRNSINSVPVIDEDRKVVGVVSASDLLTRLGGLRMPRGHRFGGHSEMTRKAHGVTAEDLMSTPVITARPHMSIGDAARELARHRIRSMPVVDRDGVLIGVVSRIDLIKLFLRSDEDICNDVMNDVIRPFAGSADDVRLSVREGVVTLSGNVSTALAARRLVLAAERVPGVIGVQDELHYDINDLYVPPMTHY